MIWKKAYRIERIDRHSDLDPGRRWFDPGEGFPWLELLHRTWS
jgi:N-acetyl-anhydromuramyl-L-alanine amidase AmpD